MPLLGSTADARNQVFHRLKPPCVALSQAALALNGPGANVQLATTRLEDLKREISSLTAGSNTLDEKLADYVFFPLSHVLKASQKVSIRCLELAFQCLSILIDRGWRAHIQSQLAVQIVILCTLMGEKRPKGLASPDSTDELQTSAFRCMYHLFTVLDLAPDTKAVLVSEANFPQLGQTITTILDGILDGRSSDSQIAAVNALQALIRHGTDQYSQAVFLPGIASKLTKVLTPQTKQRRNHVVLVGALDVLSVLFTNTLADKITPSSKKDSPGTRESKESSVIDDKWRQNAAVQLKSALTSILKLKDHSRLDVKEAVAQLCFVVLKECHETLASCLPLALETALLLASDDSGDVTRFRLEALAGADPATTTLVQNTVHSWLQALPTLMQAADDHAKLQRFHQIKTAYEILLAGNAEISSINRMLSSVLRDSLVITLQTHQGNHNHVNPATAIQSLDLSNFGDQTASVTFDSPLVKSKGQVQIVEAIHTMTEVVNSSSASTSFSADLSRSLRQLQGDMQLATFWLLLDATQTSLDQHDAVDALLTFDNDSSALYSSNLEDLYSFSLDVLNEASERNLDSRFRAVALRVLALRARQHGEEFRFELIDALYPVLHALATPDEQLQQDSITTLNIFSDACGYGSVKDLIVENVDYLTNAVALKLNAFDVSPQAPQVLLMMVRLAGPSLLPYLEDTIDSIFAALEDYHGYPLLVELLFQVLSVVAEEGAKAPQLAITQASPTDLFAVSDERWRPTSISSLAGLLKERVDAERDFTETAGREYEAHPKRPWGEVKRDNNGEETADMEDNEQEEEPPEPVSDPPPPAPKTYNLLLRISELTQHFIPSASASLRTSLLALLRKTTPAIARHENSFLPLINTLWPEIVARIDDDEPHVVAYALDIIGLLCEHAGDFMRTRIIQLWPGLVELHESTTKNMTRINRPVHSSHKGSKKHASASVVTSRVVLGQAITRMEAAPANYSDTSTRLVWESLVRVITAIVRYVEVPADLFDGAVEMLDSVLEDDDVRIVLERENADAVWLARVLNGATCMPKPPSVGQLTFPSLNTVPG